MSIASMYAVSTPHCFTCASANNSRLRNTELRSSGTITARVSCIADAANARATRALLVSLPRITGMRGLVRTFHTSSGMVMRHATMVRKPTSRSRL
ncbi:hypothetical protein B7767_19985 [Streptomyces sp. 13-12-16]|nr:hypothetical protein B7767_19985 [Streptomyces sp. 13-12-16]